MSRLTCPVCSIKTSTVIDSRTTTLLSKDVVRRRHKCSRGHRWSTYELNALLVDQLVNMAEAVKELEKALKAGKVKIKGGKIVEEK